MADLSAFSITRRWPATRPDEIQLYSFATPNGVKVSIALEEMGLPYEAHAIDILKDDQKTPEFLSLNPNGKIPAILDPNGPAGQPIGLFESGAILAYLAEKSGRLLPTDAHGRHRTLQWVWFQVGGVGPMFGQFGFFHRFAGKDIADKRPLERYRDEAKRLLGVLERQLQADAYLAGPDYTIADIATFPWVRTMRDFYEAGDLVGLDGYPAVMTWLETCLARPAVQIGLQVPARK